MTERRRYPRHRVWFPVQLDTQTAQGCVAACHDASASGLLLRTPCPLNPGEEVSLAFRVMETQPRWIQMRGRVVRVEVEIAADPHDDENGNPWPVWVAVAFETPMPKIELLCQVAEAKRGSGTRPRRVSRAA